MHRTTTESAYGPDNYQALLAQSEDEIIPPKRTPRVLKDIQKMRRFWERFCQEILQKVNPVEHLRNLPIRNVQVFLRWYMRKFNMRKITALLNRIKDWSMMYRDDVGRSVDKEMIRKINTYARTTLTTEFSLDPTATLKESTNENDLHYLLTYLWMEDTHIYPVERQRVQQGFITLLIALTTVRPGALVESSCYRGSNEALLYRDVTLRLIRDPEDCRRTVLLMEVTVKLWKGEREKMKPVTFVFYEHDFLLFCPILHMLSLAFTDHAFDSDDIESIQDIYNHKIPAFKESTTLRWKDEWIPRPIFRRACSTTSGLVTSSVKALPYASYASQMSALGSGAGFRAGVTAYAFRRGAAQVVNKIATPAERNQIMGHHNSAIFEKHYQNRVVSIDISAAFLKMPSRDSLIASVGHIGIDRDPRAPQRLSTEEQDAALTDRDYVSLQARIKKFRASIYENHQQPTCKKKTNEDQRKLQALQSSRSAARTRLLKRALIDKRHQFFSRIDNDDIHQTKRGIPVTHNPYLPVHPLAGRANLASIFSQRANQSDRRLEALQNLIDLCQTREPHDMNPASGASKGATAQMEDTMSALEEVQTEHEIRDLQKAFETMELVPLELPSTICLFCLGNDELTIQARTASFSRIDSLRRHMDDVHLSQYDPNVPLLCPHPSCDISLEGVNRFKNHAALVHNVLLSK